LYSVISFIYHFSIRQYTRIHITLFNSAISELAGMALQMVRSFFGQGTPSRSRVHEPVIDSESFGNQGGNSPYDTGDVGKSADSNWFELAWHPKETSELGRKPHSTNG